MESLVVVALMVLIIEIREWQWKKRFDDMGMVLEDLSDISIKSERAISVELGSLSESVKKSIGDHNGKIETLESVIVDLKRDQEDLKREYELRLRRHEDEKFDGVVGL